MRIKWWMPIMLLGLIATAATTYDRRNFIIFSGAATDTTGIYMADSSTVFFTAASQQLWLYLKPNRPCRVAIQVRAHGDSTQVSGAVAYTDTTKSASWPWRGYVGGAGTLLNTTDSTSWNELTSPTSTAGGEDEMIYEFKDYDGTSLLKWSGPRAKWIPLRQVDTGTFYWGEHTSIRLRVLFAGGVVTWKATLFGVGGW